MDIYRGRARFWVCLRRCNYNNESFVFGNLRVFPNSLLWYYPNSLLLYYLGGNTVRWRFSFIELEVLLFISPPPLSFFSPLPFPLLPSLFTFPPPLPPTDWWELAGRRGQWFNWFLPQELCRHYCSSPIVNWTATISHPRRQNLSFSQL